MPAPVIFDEALSLRRLELALRREDWAMFGVALDKLHRELQRRSPFRHQPRWHAFWLAAEHHGRLPGELKERLRSAVESMAPPEASAVVRAERPVPREPEPVELGGTARWEQFLRRGDLAFQAPRPVDESERSRKPRR